MSGGHVLVTGGSRGIGLEVVRRLAADGRRVTICARGVQEARAVLASLPGSGHDVLAIDVAELAAWDAAAPALRDVEGVVCAAGTLGPIGAVEDVDASAVLDALRVNVIGVFAAIRACAPGLRASDGAAVVFSGGGATGAFPRFDAYAASKAAVVRLTENLSADGLRVNAIAPGFIGTAMQDEVLAAGPERVGAAYHARVSAASRDGAFDDPAAAAELTALLLSPEGRGISGKLLSAIWDPWRDPGFRDRLRTERDLATLRRIDDQFFTTAPPAPTEDRSAP